MGLEDLVEEEPQGEADRDKEPASRPEKNDDSKKDVSKESWRIPDSDSDAEMGIPEFDIDDFVTFSEENMAAIVEEGIRKVQQQKKQCLFWCGHLDSCFLLEP